MRAIGTRAGPGLALVTLLVLLWGCRASGPNTPEAIPQTYTDTRLGFSFEHLGDWRLTSSTAQEGPVTIVTSPDDTVSVQVIRDFPPPTAGVAGYGPAMVEMLRLSLPGLKVDQTGTETLRDGTPAYRARFTVPGEITQRGELLVVIRGTEAFLVQASAPQTAYAAWTGGVRTILDSFRLVPRAV